MIPFTIILRKDMGICLIEAHIDSIDLILIARDDLHALATDDIAIHSDISPIHLARLRHSLRCLLTALQGCSAGYSPSLPDQASWTYVAMYRTRMGTLFACKFREIEAWHNFDSHVAMVLPLFPWPSQPSEFGPSAGMNWRWQVSKIYLWKRRGRSCLARSFYWGK